MKATVTVCTVSLLTLAVLAAVYLDHFGRPFLGLPAGAATVVAFAVLGINLAAAVLAFAYRRRGRWMAWVAMALALGQVATVLVTA